MADGTEATFVTERVEVPGLRQVYGYQTSDAAPSVHRGLPTASLTFIVSLEDRVRGTDGPGRPLKGPGSFAHEVLVSQLHRTPAYVHQPPRQVGVQMAVHPLQARRLFGVPAAALTDFTHEGRDLLGGVVDELRERLEDLDGWSDRMVVIRRFLHQRMASTDGAAGSAGRAVRPELTRGWQLLARSGGTLAVAQVAREVGLSARQFTKVWTAEVGVGPKEVGRIMRFERAVERLNTDRRAGRRPVLADVAARSGFADQSHLVREFHQFAGCAPGVWMAEER